MSSGLISDSTLNLAQKAIEGLNLRRDVISQNIANVDTPGYQAQQVNFETALQSAIKAGSALPLTTTNDRHVLGIKSETGNLYEIGLRKGGSTRADGNNVNIDQELEQMTETGISYQALTTAITKKLSLLKLIAER
jgi:flagellar basal-body rod protein FlgB